MSSDFDFPLYVPRYSDFEDQNAFAYRRPSLVSEKEVKPISVTVAGSPNAQGGIASIAPEPFEQEMAAIRRRRYSPSIDGIIDEGYYGA